MKNDVLVSEREVLSAKISVEAATGFRDFCAENGITVTAFLEVAGLQLAAETAPPTIKARVQMVEQARRIDQERRSRKA